MCNFECTTGEALFRSVHFCKIRDMFDKYVINLMSFAAYMEEIYYFITVIKVSMHQLQKANHAFRNG